MFSKENNIDKEIQKISVEDLKKYKEEYSEEKFWDKVKQYGKKLGCETLRQALILFYVLWDPETPVEHKAIIIGALGYFILPVDLVPDFVAGLGFVDDVTVIAKALHTVAISIKDKHRQQAEEKLKELC
jgi:uncharacterized membrane protein YkvA (DUF1232 family)